MMNVLFKRSSSSALSSNRHRCISPLHSLFTLTLSSHHVSNPTPLAESKPSGAQSFLPDNSNYRRTPRSEFHSGLGNLRFRETPGLSSSQLAVAYNDSASSDEGLDISKLGIDPDIVGALASRGIFKLFPIQRAVLEPAMQGRDMIGRAKTGTGKTLAFGIPILDKIYQFNAKHGRGRNPLAMVLAPTRELAKQVEKEFHESAPKLDTLCVYGGTPIQQQMSQLNYGVDVVVGTPGRVIDLLKRGALNLSEIQFIVLDEADQMLNVGFEEAVEVILEKSPKKRQTLMFSATMPNWIRNLSQKYLNDPLVVDLVGEDNQKLAEGISLYSIVSDTYEKASIVGPLVKEHGKGGKCIVFTGTKRDADRLAYAMSSSYGCEALHGDISQAQRERTLAGFRDGKFNILCATDVAARGLDIPNVDLVIHYDLANTSEIFVHRSGRTGRAGKKGNVILIHSAQQSRDVKLIEREVGCKFVQLPSIEGDGVTLGNMGGGLSIFGKLLGGRFSSGGGRYSSGGYGDRGSSRGGFGNSGLGRSSDYGGSSFGRTGGYGGGSGRSGSFGGSGLGESGGGFGNSNRDSGNFRGSFGGSGSGESGGGSGNSNRYSGNFGGSFGGSGSGESGGGSGNSNRYSGNFGGSGSGRTGSFRSSSSLSGGGFGNLSSGSFGDTGTSHFGNFGDNDNSTPKWSF